MLLIVANVLLVFILLIMSCCYLKSMKRRVERSNAEELEDVRHPGASNSDQDFTAPTIPDPPPTYEQAVCSAP